MTIILQYTEDLGSCFLFALDTGSGSEWNSNNENAYEEALLQALKSVVLRSRWRRNYFWEPEGEKSRAKAEIK